MSVQILTYDNKVVTVNTGTGTKVLAAGTIPQDASDWVEATYANNPNTGSLVYQSQVKRYLITAIIFSKKGTFHRMAFSYFASTVPAETLSGLIASLIANVGDEGHLVISGSTGDLYASHVANYLTVDGGANAIRVYSGDSGGGELIQSGSSDYYGVLLSSQTIVAN